MLSRNIEQAAARLRWVVWILWGLLMAAYIAGRLGPADGTLHLETRVGQHESLGPALLLADASMLLLTVALFRLSQMLAAVTAGSYFSAEVVRGFRSFAFWLLLLALLWLATPVVAELLRHQSGADGEFTFHIVIRDVLTLGITFILFLVARLLERAREIESEMREIV